MRWKATARDILVTASTRGGRMLRNPVALDRLKYDAPGRQVRYRSDKLDGPTPGTETVDPLEFLARVTAHIPNKHQVLTRYYGYYANRVRGARCRRARGTDTPMTVADPVPLRLRDARRRWAELLRQIFEVDPLEVRQSANAVQ
jgi:hypothetical protein